MIMLGGFCSVKKYFVLLFLFIAFILIGCTSKNYKIVFVDWDDTILADYDLRANEVIPVPDNPTRPGHIFIGWDKDFDKATKSLTIKALYQAEIYTVTFKGLNGEVLKEENVEYGKSATAPTITNPVGATFIKWDKEFTNIQGNLVVTAEFQKDQFTVKFYGLNNELLKEEVVEYGDKATAPSVTGNAELQFDKWDKDFSNVISNLEVKALFKQRVNKIQFYDGKQELFFDVNSYTKDDDFVLPKPTKAGHEFIGWFLSEISLYEIDQINDKLVGDLKLYSRWVKTEQNQFTAPANAIEFEAINKNPHSSGVGFVYQPKIPAGARSTSVTAYTWASSNESVAKISAWSSISVMTSGYAIITGTLTSDPTYVLYCVIQTSADGVQKVSLEEANKPNYVYATFNFEGGKTIKKIATKGGFVIPPTPDAKDGFAFVGWEGENGETIYNITKDTTFNAKYVEGINSYVGKTISIIGDSITTYSGYIPSGFDYFYPYPTADFGDVNQTWWMQVINHYGMKLLVNNSWSGSAVAGTATSAAQSKSRLNYSFIGEVKPDIILIFMGANDAGSIYITKDQFDDAYGKMIKNLKEMSPESEIIVCTLPSIKLYSEQDQVDYNDIIKKYATNNSLKVIDYTQAFTRNESEQFLVDSAHPNKAGMNKLAEVAIKDFGK